MIVSFIVILFTLIADIYYYNYMIKIVSKTYNIKVDLISALDLDADDTIPYHLKLRSNTNQLMRILVLTLFWLTIDLSIKFIDDAIDIFSKSEIKFVLEFIKTYSLYIFIIIGCFIYFILHMYYNNNFYIRTIDITVGVLFTSFIVYMA